MPVAAAVSPSTATWIELGLNQAAKEEEEDNLRWSILKCRVGHAVMAN